MEDKKFTYFLPKCLYNQVREEFPIDTLSQKNDRRRVLKLLHVLTKKSQQKNGNPDGFVEMGSNYMRLMLNGSYGSLIKRLKKKGIIENFSTPSSKESYIVRGAINPITDKMNVVGVCKKIRICQKVSFSNSIKDSVEQQGKVDKASGGLYLSPTFKESGLVAVDYLSKPKSKSDENIAFEKEFRGMVSKIDIPYEALFDKVFELVNKIDLGTYKFKDDLKESDLIRVKCLTSGKKIPMFVSTAKGLAEYRHETIFQDGLDYYMGGKEQFLEVFRRNAYFSYMNSIERIKNDDINAGRNSVNRRLDTNFTNMKSELYNVIMKHNKMVTIDLCNSQFTILANYLYNEKDFRSESFLSFRELCVTGKLYDVTAEELNITRDEAKTLYFRILFDKVGSNISYKDKLRERFPEVVNYTDRFKKSRGYKKFSVFLQNKESFMFIDNLHSTMKSEFDVCFTKHDSLTVREENMDRALEIMKDYFKEVKFCAQVQVTKYNDGV